MNKKQTMMIALGGAALMAVSQAQAQLNYNDGDLLLNFRNSTIAEGSTGGNDVEIDLGQVTTFVGTANTIGGQIVLDSGSGYATSAYTTQFTGASLATAVGVSATSIGFSAAAENQNNSLPITDPNGTTLFLTRALPSAPTSSASVTPYANAQQGTGFQTQTGNRIANIGGATGTALAGSPAGVGMSISDSASFSYHNQAGDAANSTLIDYGAYQNASSPSAIEATPSTGNVYEALWQVPVGSGTGSDVYEGFFTFQPDGEVDFNAGYASAVPEPSTYGLIAGLALLGLAFRRQLRALAA